MTEGHYDATQREWYLLELLELLRDQTISDEQFAELQDFVINDPAACKMYVDAVTLQSNLEWTQDFTDSTKAVSEPFFEESTSKLNHESSESFPVSPLLTPLFGQPLDSIVEDWYQKPGSVDLPIEGNSSFLGNLGGVIGRGMNSSIGFTLGVSFLVLLPVVLLFVVMSRPSAENLPPMVATILRQTSGTQWGGDLIAPTGAKVFLGQRLRMQTGTVELQMVSGVRVLLEGNTSIFLTGPNAIYLERGSLVAQVMPDAIGFTVRAPDADFVDLGTEFGVVVDPGKMSKTKVLAGKINVETENKEGKKTQKQLYANEAAQIAQNGEVEPIDPNSLAFTSVYPDDRVCLFNLICRTNNSYYPDGLWIDPVDGGLKMPTDEKWILGESVERTSNHAYWVTPSLPVVDGVFTPIPGKQTLVNSKGGRFGGIGNGTNLSFCHVCVGETKALASWNIVDDHIRGVLAEIDKIGSGLSNDHHPFIYLHSNLGITFDLDAVRQQKGRKVVQFLTSAKKLEDVLSEAEGKPSVVDVLVLADEKLIYEKRGVTCQDGVFPIRIDVPENTRFLSIISADGKDTHTFDHLVLDRPAFVLENKALRKGTEDTGSISTAEAR